tara:strand:+ start:17070 stop:18173 length:1104 start_codon:yes stop_codon:yes gene_type:complete
MEASDDDNETVIFTHDITLPASAQTVTSQLRPSWTRIRRPDKIFNTPTCTLQKLIAFAMILHPRLGKQRFGKKYHVHNGSIAYRRSIPLPGNVLPVEVVRMILEYAVGTVDSWPFGEKEACKSLYTLMKNHLLRQAIHCRVRNISYGGYWNVPFIVATAFNDSRFISKTGCAPSNEWLSKFMDTRFFHVPMVAACPRKFYKRITGTRTNQDPMRHAFSGCRNAWLVRESTRELTYEHSWMERSILQTWWDAHYELFQHSQRFHLPNEIARPLSNLMVFSARNPGTTGVFNGPKQLHRFVTAALVRRWLEDMWGEYNVKRFVRVRELREGVQIFIFGPKITPWIDAIMESEMMQTFGREYAKKTFIPL